MSRCWRPPGTKASTAAAVRENRISSASCWSKPARPSAARSAVCIREAQRTLAQSSKRLIESKIAALGLGNQFKVFSDKIETPGDGLIIFRGMQDDAGKYRLMMKARDAAAAKPVPPVQRPGMARTPAEREHADLRTLNARLSSSGDIKDAVALYNAREKSSGAEADIAASAASLRWHLPRSNLSCVRSWPRDDSNGR